MGIPEWSLGVVVVIGAIVVAQIIVKVFRASGRALPTSEGESGELRRTVDALQNRLGELEERVDFTERLLAQSREAGRLGPPPQ